MQTEISATIETLDQTLGLAVEDMFGYCFERDLLNGIVIGVLQDNSVRIGTAGKGVSAESVFEIGSVTKIFTVELIDILVSRGLLKWEDPVALYLSDELKARHDTADRSRCIRLIDLANHHSGLPLLPPRMRIVQRDNPYGSFSTADLEQYLGTIDLKLPESPRFLYSNVGYALLGHAIENATNQCYSDLLKNELLLPSGLSHTDLALVNGQAPEVVQGYAQAGRPARRWLQDAFAPAGALCSTVHDQLRWMQCVLDRPNRRALAYGSKASTDKDVLGWEIHPIGESFYRVGLTGGFSSYCSVNPDRGYGLVLLANRSSLFLTRAIALNLERQLRGLPMLPLSGDYGKFRARVLDFIRRGEVAGHLFGMIRSTKYGAHVLDWLRRATQ